MDLGAVIAIMAVGIGGILGLGGLLLGAYKVHLDGQRERAEIASGGVDRGTVERIEQLELQVERLSERADFTDKLLGSGRDG